MAGSLAKDIRAGIAAFGMTQRLGRTVYAYEVDGFGNILFMVQRRSDALPMQRWYCLSGSWLPTEWRRTMPTSRACSRFPTLASQASAILCTRQPAVPS